MRNKITEVRLVMNVQGSSKKHSGDNLRECWEEITGFEAKACSNLLCPRKETGDPQRDYGKTNPIVGGHIYTVRLVNGTKRFIDNTVEWIIPICTHCNNQGKEGDDCKYYFAIHPDLELVKAPE